MGSKEKKKKNQRCRRSCARQVGPAKTMPGLLEISFHGEGKGSWGKREKLKKGIRGSAEETRNFKQDFW